MKKRHLLILALLGLSTLQVGAKDFYEFDNVTAESVLQLFLKVKKQNRIYPNIEEFAEIGMSPADIEFIRSHVRLNPLVNPEDRLYPTLYKDRKIYMCTPMGNGSQGAHGYPTNEMGKTDVWTMWNYTSTFGSWNHGFFQAPGSWTDAAHKNGSRLMAGQMFFEKAFGGADDQPWVTFISQKDEDGNYTYVEPMLNALMYFGQDGIVYNWEANLYSDPDVIAFHKALYKEARKRQFDSYGSTIYTLSNQLSSYNASQIYGTAQEPIHEVFVNYSGGAITPLVGSSQSYAEANCGGTDRLYAGVHIVSLGNRNWEQLSEADAAKTNLIIWGEHTANQIYSHTKGETDAEWQANYQQMQERFFSGGNNNPAKLPSGDPDDATYNDGISTFCGLAKYMPERSALSTPFLTHFNVGNGQYWYTKGQPVTAGGWYNMASQDVVPTYRWLVYKANTTEVSSSLTPTFTHTDAYNGGSCLSLKGNAGTEGADVILYKTNIKLESSPKATLVTRQLGGNAQLSLIIRVDGVWQEYSVEGMNSAWHAQEISLDKLNGGIVDRIGFRVKGDADILVGKLQLNDGTTVTPKPIKEFVSAQTVSESTDDITLKLYWTVDGVTDSYGRSFNDVNNIDHFEVFAEINGQEVEVGRTTQWVTLASHIPFPASASTLRVGVRSVSTDLKTASEIVWKTVAKGEPDKQINPNDTTGQGPYYTINFNKEAPHAREDRYVMHVGVYDYQDGNDGTLQQYPDNNLTARITKQFYLDKTDEVVFNLTAGQTYRPYLAYHGLWMSGYAYIDWNNDGKFDTDNGISFDSYSGKPTRLDNCEVVSYSAHTPNPDSSYSYWYNSNGVIFDTRNQFPKDNNIKNWMGSFTVPADQPEGIYRMRFKLDWCDFNPGGNKSIRDNGGDIVDVLVNVHKAGGQVKIGADAQNGTVTMGSTILDKTFNGTTPNNSEVAVKFAPEENYKVAGVTIKHGYNLDGESHDKVGNRQWWIEKLQLDAEEYTIPANYVNGNILVIPVFTTTNGISEVETTKTLLYQNDVYNLNGQLVRKAGSSAALPVGIYVVKGNKFVVK